MLLNIRLCRCGYMIKSKKNKLLKVDSGKGNETKKDFDRYKDNDDPRSTLHRIGVGVAKLTAAFIFALSASVGVISCNSNEKQVERSWMDNYTVDGTYIPTTFEKVSKQIPRIIDKAIDNISSRDSVMSRTIMLIKSLTENPNFDLSWLDNKSMRKIVDIAENIEKNVPKDNDKKELISQLDWLLSNKNFELDLLQFVDEIIKNTSGSATDWILYIFGKFLDKSPNKDPSFIDKTWGNMFRMIMKETDPVVVDWALSILNGDGLDVKYVDAKDMDIILNMIHNVVDKTNGKAREHALSTLTNLLTYSGRTLEEIEKEF